jgi:hypothetical protein
MPDTATGDVVPSALSLARTPRHQHRGQRDGWGQISPGHANNGIRAGGDNLAI